MKLREVLTHDQDYLGLDCDDLSQAYGDHDLDLDLVHGPGCHDDDDGGGGRDVVATVVEKDVCDDGGHVEEKEEKEGEVVCIGCHPSSGCNLVFLHPA